MAAIALATIVGTTKAVVAEVVVKVANVDTSGVVVGLLLIHHEVWTSNGTWIPIVMLNPRSSCHRRISSQSMVPRGTKVVSGLAVLCLALAEEFLL